MNISDIFKGKNLIALIAAIVVCTILFMFGMPKIVIIVVAFALGCNNKNFAEWVETKILVPLKRIF